MKSKILKDFKFELGLYDGPNVLFEKDAGGLTQKSCTRGLGFPGGIGGLISMKRYEMDDDGLEEKTNYYHYDALGSVRGLSDGQGKLKAQYEYDAFGARCYDPEVGRWITPDPRGVVDGVKRIKFDQLIYIEK